MYELKKMERYLRVNLLGTGPRFMKKRIYHATVSQRLRNTGVQYCEDAMTRMEKKHAHAPGKICNDTGGINIKAKEDP